MSRLWTPTEARIDAALMTRFARQMSRKYGIDGADYQALHAWSVEDTGRYWREAWDFCGLVGEKGPVAFTPSDDIRDCDFFAQARLNVAETFLKNADHRPALTFVGEDGQRFQWSRAELRDQVSRIAAALKAAGVAKGDAVGGFVPNMPQTVAAMLAVASIGAVWSSCSPDFGPDAVEDRLGQIKPKVLFAAEGYFYNGKVIDCREVLAQIQQRLQGVERIVIWPYALGGVDVSAIPRAETLEDFIAGHPVQEIDYQPMGFRDPLFVMFSSGTTGKPKCILHSGGGVLLRTMAEHQMQLDVKPGSRMFYFTTCGWMMWNWLVAGLASEAELVLFDGNPMYPGSERLFQLIEAEKINLFGVSAKYIDACLKAGMTPGASHDLSSLNTVMSTGSPLAPDGFEHVYRDWKPDVHLASICGGTDILGVFIGGCATLPVHKGEIQAPVLGLDVQVVAANAVPVKGEAGELVCRNAHPSMPIGFMDDPDGARYRSAYFDVYPNIWRQGDFVIHTEHFGYIVLGRSDATLNPGGVRIGTAEIYRQVEPMAQVLEACVVGQSWDNDVRVVLFVRLAEGVELDEALIGEIRTRIRKGASPRHVPAVILPIADIPRTKTGKIAELAVRDVIHGRAVENITALANPEALKFYAGLEALA